MQHQYSKGLVLLVFTVFKIEEKEFYIMDFKLGFEKLLLSWGLFDELLYSQSWSFLHILFFLFLKELPNQN